MTGLSVLMLGLGLGLRHAVDADHVVVVSALLQREPGALRAARIAALWGAGHSISFLGVGLVVVLAGVRVPPELEAIAELLVAAMLMGLGGWHLVRSLSKAAPPAGEPAARAYARPVLVGVVHGLAGSAGIALLVSATIASRAWAAAYLALFGLGTVMGMVMLTAVLAWPIAWTMRREGSARRVVGAASALLSVALGAAIAVEAVLRDHAG